MTKAIVSYPMSNESNCKNIPITVNARLSAFRLTAACQLSLITEVDFYVFHIERMKSIKQNGGSYSVLSLKSQRSSMIHEPHLGFLAIHVYLPCSINQWCRSYINSVLLGVFLMMFCSVSSTVFPLA